MGSPVTRTTEALDIRRTNRLRVMLHLGNGACRQDIQAAVGASGSTSGIGKPKVPHVSDGEFLSHRPGEHVRARCGVFHAVTLAGAPDAVALARRIAAQVAECWNRRAS